MPAGIPSSTPTASRVGWSRSTPIRRAESPSTRISSSGSKESARTRSGWKVATRPRTPTVIHEPGLAVVGALAARCVPRPQSRHGVAVRGGPGVTGKPPKGGAGVAAAHRARPRRVDRPGGVARRRRPVPGATPCAPHRMRGGADPLRALQVPAAACPSPLGGHARGSRRAGALVVPDGDGPRRRPDAVSGPALLSGGGGGSARRAPRSRSSRHGSRSRLDRTRRRGGARAHARDAGGDGRHRARRLREAGPRHPAARLDQPGPDLGGRDRGGGLVHAVYLRCSMTSTGFAVICLLSYLVPVPILAWLDRPRRTP